MTDAIEQAAATHAQVAHSAAALKESAVKQVDSADRRTELAADRTVLAAERTYAAWVRTGLTALAAGVGARALLKGLVAKWIAILGGDVLVLFSAACYIAAVWRELLPVRNPVAPEARRLPAAMLVVVNGVLVLVSLATFVGLLTSL